MGKILKIGIIRHLLALTLALASLLSTTSVTTLSAASGERTLYLFYTHTNETKRITFRRNGRFDQSGLSTLNQFLRDWRRNEPTRMDPALFDLLWKVYQDVGATKPIHVVSAYRSPRTNNMLRSNSRGVAKNSRHTMGMAIDFFIPGVAISKLRETAMRYQVGGVGYYPTAGNPFVHLDTGNVRAWPRMTRNQLARLFPNGKTLHIASDGSVLSASGRRYASAEWARCNSVPCSGSNSITTPTRAESNSNTGSGRTLMDLFFGNNNEDEAASTPGNTPSNTPANTPARRTVTTVAVLPPTPAPRAGFLAARDPVTPPTPAIMSPTLFSTTRAIQATPSAQLDPIVVASIPNLANRPAPRILLSSERTASSELLAAYAPIIEPEPDAQRALQMLIERRNETATSVETAPPLLRGSIVSASLAPIPVQTAVPATPAPSPVINTEYQNLFDNTFEAIAAAHPNSSAPQENIALAVLNKQTRAIDLPITMRRIEFFAPEFEHMDGSLFTAPSISVGQYAILFEPDESHFSPTTELGPQSGQVVFTQQRQKLFSDRFTQIAPIIITNT